MRALHLLNAFQGGQWACDQAKVLTANGVEVHVALPAVETPISHAGKPMALICTRWIMCSHCADRRR